MAIPIRSVPVLEGEVAHRFIKEAKENEKKRGSLKFSEEETSAFRAMIEKAKKNGSFIFL
jgi:hypothetical protein